MYYIMHRRNTVEELLATPQEYGIEVDIRSYGRRLIVHHDPFVDAVDFQEWIMHYSHRMLVLNIKEEGIEQEVKAIVERKGIIDYFFLDLSFPALVKMVAAGEQRVGVRFSEYESLDTVMRFANRAGWVWVDYFKSMPMTDEIHGILAKNFKICLVSPELQGHNPSLIQEIKHMLVHLSVDAICTKRPELWKK